MYSNPYSTLMNGFGNNPYEIPFVNDLGKKYPLQKSAYKIGKHYAIDKSNIAESNKNVDLELDKDNEKKPIGLIQKIKNKWHKAFSSHDKDYNYTNLKDKNLIDSKIEKIPKGPTTDIITDDTIANSKIDDNTPPIISDIQIDNINHNTANDNAIINTDNIPGKSNKLQNNIANDVAVDDENEFEYIDDGENLNENVNLINEVEDYPSGNEVLYDNILKRDTTQSNSKGSNIFKNFSDSDIDFMNKFINSLVEYKKINMKKVETKDEKKDESKDEIKEEKKDFNKKVISNNNKLTDKIIANKVRNSNNQCPENNTKTAQKWENITLHINLEIGNDSKQEYKRGQTVSFLAHQHHPVWSIRTKPIKRLNLNAVQKKIDDTKNFLSLARAELGSNKLKGIAAVNEMDINMAVKDNEAREIQSKKYRTINDNKQIDIPKESAISNDINLNYLSDLLQEKSTDLITNDIVDNKINNNKKRNTDKINMISDLSTSLEDQLEDNSGVYEEENYNSDDSTIKNRKCIEYDDYDSIHNNNNNDLCDKQNRKDIEKINNVEPLKEDENSDNFQNEYNFKRSTFDDAESEFDEPNNQLSKNNEDDSYENYYLPYVMKKRLSNNEEETTTINENKKNEAPLNEYENNDNIDSAYGNKHIRKSIDNEGLKSDKRTNDELRDTTKSDLRKVTQDDNLVIPKFYLPSSSSSNNLNNENYVEPHKPFFKFQDTAFTGNNEINPLYDLKPRKIENANNENKRYAINSNDYIDEFYDNSPINRNVKSSNSNDKSYNNKQFDEISDGLMKSHRKRKKSKIMKWLDNKNNIDSLQLDKNENPTENSKLNNNDNPMENSKLHNNDETINFNNLLNNEPNEFAELGDFKGQLNLNQEETISNFIKTLNSPPQIFNFDLDKYMNSETGPKTSRESSIILDKIQPQKTFFEFLPDSIDKENIIAPTENKEKHDYKRRDTLREYIKGVSALNNVNEKYNIENIVKTSNEEPNSNSESSVPYANNNPIEYEANNLDLMSNNNNIVEENLKNILEGTNSLESGQYGKYFTDSDMNKYSQSKNPVKKEQPVEKDDFIDNFYLLNDGSYQTNSIYDTKPVEKPVVTENKQLKYDPSSLAIDLDLDKKFRDLYGDMQNRNFNDKKTNK